MSLFSQLRRLSPSERFRLEDFHTEIVAQVLRNSPLLRVEWLSGIGATKILKPDEIAVVTQEEFAALDEHATDSRPDIAVRLAAGDREELILIESKVGAREGLLQLRRYAEHLATKPHSHSTALVYITRDFEPAKTLSKMPKKVEFRQTRWFEFYRYLLRHAEGDTLAGELLLFMEENNMSQRNQLTTIDALALTNFSAARKMMDATMRGAVSEALGKKLGRVSKPKRAMIQLYEHQRYIMYSMFGPKGDLKIMLGYWFNDETPAEYPWVGMMMDVNPKSTVRSQIVTAMRSLLAAKEGTWEGDRMADEHAWSNIYRGRELRDFLSGADHVEAIKAYFLKLVTEIGEFRAKNKGLPWSAGTPDEDDE